MANIVVEKRKEFEAKQKELADIFEQMGGDRDLSKVTLIEGDNAAKASEIQRRNTELNELRKEVELHQEVLKVAGEHEDREKFLHEPQHPKGFHGKGGGQEAEQKTIGKLFIESDAFKLAKGGNGPTAELKGVDLKALFQTSDGWAPEVTREGRVVLSAQRPIQVFDILPQRPTMQTGIKFMRETVFTNNAAETDEGAAYPEATLEVSEVMYPVEKVGTFLPVTDEQMEDVEEAEGYVNSRLPFMVMQRVDSQIINGTGTNGQLYGIRNLANVLTMAKEADDSAHATVYKALTKARVDGRSMPHQVLMHPTDWQNIRLAQDANGNFIMGPPGIMVEQAIWGYPVAEVDSLPVGTFVVGDFNNFSSLRTKRDIEMKVSDSHDDYFVKGKQAIRADVRLCVVWYRPQAFCIGSGI